MKATLQQRIYIYDYIVEARATVLNEGVKGFITYDQIKEIADYLRKEAEK